MSPDPVDEAPGAEERVFAEPWEGRAFALATALHARGAFAWSDFQQRLVREIEAWNATHAIDAPYSYYRLWLQALEGLIAERDLCALDELDAIVDALGRATPGHDHVARREPIAVDPPAAGPDRPSRG